jgi:hypothetical protein
MWTAARGRFGLLYPLFCCFFTLSPCFIVDGWQMSPLLAIWAFGAVARWFFHDRQIVTDSIVFAIVYAVLTRGELKDTIVGRWEGLDISVVAAWWVLISYFAIPLAALALLLRWRASRKPTNSNFPDGISAWTLQYPKIRIFPSQIKHARMFPKRHAFEYSYLQCGFPVIPGGVMADGTDVGSGDDLQIGSWWLRIRAEDYLSRGNGALGFYGKLQSYLREQVRGIGRVLVRTSFRLQGANGCSILAIPNGRTHTLSRHHALWAMHLILYRFGISMMQIISSRG